MKALIYYAILISMVLAGVFLVYLGKIKTMPILDALGNSLVVGGGTGVLFQAFVNRHQEKELKELLGIHDTIHRSGLKELYVGKYNLKWLIERSDDLILVVRDGRSNVRDLTTALRGRFSKSTVTKIFMLAEDGDYIDIIAKKVGHTKEQYVERLKDTERELKDAYNTSAKKGTLEVWRLASLPMYSMYLSGKILVISLYHSGDKKVDIPTFVFDATGRNDDVVAFVRNDLVNIEATSNLHFKLSTKPAKPAKPAKPLPPASA